MLTKADEFDIGLGELAEQAKALSHPARLAILKHLAAQNTCICGEIVEELPLAQASVSRHLKVLKERKDITNDIYWNLYKQVNGGHVRSLAHLRELAKEAKSR